jgi:hypothetical protein
MEAVPQFAGNENIFTLDFTFSEDFFKSFTNLFFVVVNPGFVNVAVPKVKGILDSLINLTFL